MGSVKSSRTKMKAFCSALIVTKGDGVFTCLLFALITLKREHPPRNEESVLTLEDPVGLEKPCIAILDYSN